ncbi:MAG: sarcosine oxidase subunit beta [Oceanicoccus sp.]|jgi:sarcosine oxidase subunit beta
MNSNHFRKGQFIVPFFVSEKWFGFVQGCHLFVMFSRLNLVYTRGKNVTVDYLIIGGGILGQAVAWTLVKASPNADIAVIEKGLCSQATTSQAAALVTQGRTKLIASAMVQDTLNAITELNSELDMPIPFTRCGGLHLAVSPDEIKSLNNMAHVAGELEIEHEFLEQKIVDQYCPFFNTGNSQSRLYFSGDGYVDGTILANSFGMSARSKGVTFFQRESVTAITQLNDGYRVSRSNQLPDIKAKHLFMCAGPWAAKLLKPLGILLPVTPMRSLYWITESYPKLNADFPMCVVPSAQAYFRQETNHMLFGVRDKGQALHPDDIPCDVHGFQFAHDQQGLEALEDTWEKLLHFWPDIEQLGLANLITGISSYSTDGLPVIGCPASHSNLTIVSGCSGAGIAYSAGIAKHAVTHAITGGIHNELDINRFPLGDAYAEHFRNDCLLARSQKTAG